MVRVMQVCVSCEQIVLVRMYEYVWSINYYVCLYTACLLRWAVSPQWQWLTYTTTPHSSPPPHHHWVEWLVSPGSTMLGGQGWLRQPHSLPQWSSSSERWWTCVCVDVHLLHRVPPVVCCGGWEYRIERTAPCTLLVQVLAVSHHGPAENGALLHQGK